MTPQERANAIGLEAYEGSVNRLGGWELNEDKARADIVAAIEAAVAEERESGAKDVEALAAASVDYGDDQNAHSVYVAALAAASETIRSRPVTSTTPT